MIDTLRLLVDWKCNLTCSYCCNEQPHIREQIRSQRLSDLDFSRYKVVCISGGEPLLFLNRVLEVCSKIPRPVYKVLYTNGTLLNYSRATILRHAGIDAVNVGLHIESTFHTLIERCTRAWTFGNLRFHAQDCYRHLAAVYPDCEFRFWKMNDCDRDNEDRVILEQPELIQLHP